MRIIPNAGLASFLAISIGGAGSTAAQAQQFNGAGFLDPFVNGPFSTEISTGVEYDSNVSVIDIDTATFDDDFSFLFDFGLGVDLNLAENTELKAEYDFSQEIQFDFSAFDTQTHRLGADLSHDFGPVEAGFNYQYVYARLGGNGFFSLHRAAPYVAAYVADNKAYIRASYIYSDKNFIGRIDRDAEVHAGSADLYYFLNGLSTYMIAGYRYKTEDANSPEFDYDSHTLKLRLIQRVALTERDSKLRIAWSYEDRDYDSVTPSINEVRNDQRHKFSASLEVPISKIFFTELEFRYDDFSSNLPAADFSQNVIRLSIGGRL